MKFFCRLRINKTTQVTDDWSSIVSTPMGLHQNHHCLAQLLGREQTGGKAGLTAKERMETETHCGNLRLPWGLGFGRYQQCLSIFPSQSEAETENTVSLFLMHSSYTAIWLTQTKMHSTSHSVPRLFLHSKGKKKKKKKIRFMLGRWSVIAS